MMQQIDEHQLDTREAEAFLYKEAMLLDQLQLEEWNALFTPEGIYWIPIDDDVDPKVNVSLLCDTPPRRQERVYHLLHNSFPAQSPRSRTVHFVSNVLVTGCEGNEHTVVSSQLIYEMRTGDHTQIGLGEVRPIVARVEHRLRRSNGGLQIAAKKILLLDRDGWQGNLTFII